MTDSLGAADVNPLRQALPRTRVPEPCAIVLFGATGDLAHRKLMPALYHLDRGGNLPGDFAVVGFARRDWDDEQLRAEFAKSMGPSMGPDFAGAWPQFASHLAFVPGSFDDPEGYAKLKARLEQLERTHGTRGNRLFYLAVAPEYFATIINQLGEAGLIHDVH